jgi:phenylalanyl-tRNA synthetase beta chain
MRLSLGWLAQWVDLPPETALCERLEMGGFEDVRVERTGPELAGVVVGRVVGRGRHPNADRLSLCRVDVGRGEPLEVVCGASNVAEGQKVAFAPVGTVLPDGAVLERSKIRGVVSHGMICSARELGLGDEHEGILVLDPAAEVGAPVADALGLGDRVLELGITPNRGDAASLLGVAREIRALFGGEIRLPPHAPVEAGAPAAGAVSVRIDAPLDCHAYVARVVRGVRVAPSPDWLQRRLEASGIRPIQNVVDVTNLVLLELGQPLHAFDLARLGGAEIRVRRAAAGEKLATLDGEVRELDPEDLVIADASLPVALAGVMGGAASEVSERTRDVLIESAHFHPARVRRGARRHGLHTEASYRFERGIDPEGVARAADRAARLMAELCGGSVAAGAVEARGDAPPRTAEVRVGVDRVQRILGLALGTREAADLLERVGVSCRVEAGDVLVGRIPSHRNDLQRPEDLIEEIARIHGYDRIPSTLPVAELLPVELPFDWRAAEAARDALVALGLTETMSFPFLAPADLERLRLAPDDERRVTLRLENPVSEEEPALRTTLLPGLLRLARQNRSRQVDRVWVFEVGRCFLPGGESGRPREPLHLAALLSDVGDRRLWDPKSSPPLFYRAAGIAKRVMMQMGYEVGLRSAPPPPYLHPGAAAALEVAGSGVGFVGDLHPEVAAAFDLDVACAVLEVDLGGLEALAPREIRYREVSRQPQVRRDLAVVVDRSRAAGEILAAIERAGGADLVSVELFDRYEGEGVPEGQVSLAFRLVFQRPDRTLTDAEVTATSDRVVRMLAHRFDGKLR